MGGARVEFNVLVVSVAMDMLNPMMHVSLPAPRGEFASEGRS